MIRKPLIKSLVLGATTAATLALAAGSTQAQPYWGPHPHPYWRHPYWGGRPYGGRWYWHGGYRGHRRWWCVRTGACAWRYW